MIPSASAAKVYIYEAENGTRVISDHPNRDAKLRLVKTYTPRIPIRVLRPLQYEFKTRNLQPRASVFDITIFNLADNYHQDRALIKAIVQVESDFNPHALSPKGAQGLMQLMPATANNYEVINPYDAYQNLRGGIAFFSHLMKQYNNDVRLALAAYNAGETAVSRYAGIPPYPETQSYVKHVLRLHKNYQRFSNTYS